ncbi:MAG: hypothetical protein ACOYNC_09755 [Bacteroidales bacterium]
MKSANLFRLTMLVFAIFGLALTGCKKDKNNDISADSSSLQQLAGDEESFESSMDESMNEVNNILSGGNLKSTSQLPCNATIDSTATINDTVTIYITYHGVNCNGTRYRSGKVEIKKKAGSHWYEQGATVIVKHIDFTISKMSSSKSVTLNGVKVYQNVSGGLIWQLGPELPTIVHRTWGMVNVTFNSDGSTKTWNIARQKTLSGTAPYNLVLTCDGFGSADGYDNLVVWGINRKGENFYSQIIEPVTRCQVCDWDPSAGVKKHSIPADSKSATLTFGYDRNNQPVGNECPAKYKVDWQKNNHSGTVFLWL